MVEIDTQRTRSAAAADLFIQVKPERDFELLWALRALFQGKPIQPDIEACTGVSLNVINDLAERMKRCQYGALFAGAGLITARARHYNAQAVLSLVIDLNQHTRFVALPMLEQGNAAGAGNVLAWQTGYPFAVNFGRGFPRFSPGEFSTVDLLARGEADAALIVASDPAPSLPEAALAHLKRIPTIVLHRKPTATTVIAKIAFATACYGINTGGTVYRMDDVSLALRPALSSAYPADETILVALRDRIQQMI